MAIAKINNNLHSEDNEKLNVENLAQHLKIAIAITIDIEILSLLCRQISIDEFFLVL